MTLSSWWDRSPIVRVAQAKLGASAFSSEVDTGSREENALFLEIRRVFPIQRIGKRYAACMGRAEH
jgi:hypothetical protein